jgi:hypothetical protein
MAKSLSEGIAENLRFWVTDCENFGFVWPLGRRSMPYQGQCFQNLRDDLPRNMHSFTGLRKLHIVFYVGITVIWIIIWIIMGRWWIKMIILHLWIHKYGAFLSHGGSWSPVFSNVPSRTPSRCRSQWDGINPPKCPRQWERVLKWWTKTMVKHHFYG